MQHYAEMGQLNSNETLCAIWYHLYNLENVKKHPWRSAIFSKVVGTKSNTLP